jgi:4-hydroxy-4-methyl-2-oxoglutarate aldolase
MIQPLTCSRCTRPDRHGVFGLALVRPGDVVIADDDGVCIVPHADSVAVLANAQAREARVAAKRQRFAAGELGLDIYDMCGKLKALELRYV